MEVFMNVFKKDFEFIFPNKEGLSRPVKKEQVLDKIERLRSIYCLDFLGKESFSFRNAFNEIHAILDYSFSENDFHARFEAIKKAKGIVYPLLRKKTKCWKN